MATEQRARGERTGEQRRGPPRLPGRAASPTLAFEDADALRGLSLVSWSRNTPEIYESLFDEDLDVVLG